MLRQPGNADPPRDPPRLLRWSVRELNKRVLAITDVSVKFAGRKIPLKYPERQNNTNEEVHPLIVNSDEVDVFITAQIETGEHLMHSFDLKWEPLLGDSFERKAFLDDFRETEQKISQLKVDVFTKIGHFENQFTEIHEEEQNMLFVDMSTKIQDGIQMYLLAISVNVDEFLESMAHSNGSGYEDLRKSVNTWTKNSAELSIELTNFMFYIESVEYDGTTKLKILLERTDNLKYFESFHKLVEAVGGGTLEEIKKFRTPLELYQSQLNEVLNDFQTFLEESSGLS